MCRSPSPLDVRPSSSKALLLGSMHATPGVAGPWTPAEWWVLRAWVCFGSGTEFSSEDEEKVYGTLPWECLLLFEAPALVAALILGKDYFISSCFFLSLLFFVSLSRFPSSQILCGSLRRSSPCPGSVTLLISYFPLSEYTHSSTPTLLPSASSAAPHTPFLFLYLLYSTLPTHDRLCN